MPKINDCLEDREITRKNRRKIDNTTRPLWIINYEILERDRDDPNYIANEYVRHAVAER